MVFTLFTLIFTLICSQNSFAEETKQGKQPLKKHSVSSTYRLPASLDGSNQNEIHFEHVLSHADLAESKTIKWTVHESMQTFLKSKKDRLFLVPSKGKMNHRLEVCEQKQTTTVCTPVERGTIHLVKVSDQEVVVDLNFMYPGTHGNQNFNETIHYQFEGRLPASK